MIELPNSGNNVITWIEPKEQTSWTPSNPCEITKIPPSLVSGYNYHPNWTEQGHDPDTQTHTALYTPGYRSSNTATGLYILRTEWLLEWNLNHESRKECFRTKGGLTKEAVHYDLSTQPPVLQEPGGPTIKALDLFCAQQTLQHQVWLLPT